MIFQIFIHISLAVGTNIWLWYNCKFYHGPRYMFKPWFKFQSLKIVTWILSNWKAQIPLINLVMVSTSTNSFIPINTKFIIFYTWRKFRDNSSTVKSFRVHAHKKPTAPNEHQEQYRREEICQKKLHQNFQQVWH